MGIHRTRRSLAVGPWKIDPRPFDTGPTWVDHHASREDIAGQYRRVRIYLYERESDPQTRESVRGAAQGELLDGTGLDLPARIGLVRQLAEAVGYAHERRLVHRARSATPTVGICG